MARPLLKFLLITTLIVSVQADVGIIFNELQVHKDLEVLLIDILNGLIRNDAVTCLTIVCDDVYLNVFEGALFKRTLNVPYNMIVVEDYEDLLSPNFSTLESLMQARTDGCNVYVILMANGLQLTRLLRFGDSTKNKAWFDLSTVPFPNPIKGIFISRRVDIWKNGKLHYGRDLFADKTRNLYGEILNVVYYDHLPSVVIMKSNNTKVGGVEIEILNTLAQKMKFEPKLYQSPNPDLHKWGGKLSNGSFSGLLGEMVHGKADMALGNLQYTPYHLELTDLSIPYTAQCWTFLTPEALTDNSWKTLILPFTLHMWIVVLMVLFVTGSIFYGLAMYYIHLLDYKAESVNIKKEKKYYDTKPVGLYLFGEITNSILYTYGMLLVVSLPKLPTGWSIRLLTGWYWLYCILLVVSYRASMTAILANPAPRVTIDTLKELVDSRIACGGWGTETKMSFEQSLDEIGQEIGKRFEEVNDPEIAAQKVAKGIFAYYDSSDYLKYLSVKRKNDMNFENTTSNITNYSNERNLHIMSDCVVNVPISIGFHKNSPLKPLADVYIRRIVEVGLVEKWLNDAMYKIRSMDTTEEEVKALINLKKLYCAFIALAIGYTLSFICLVGEWLHWRYVVTKDPNFDKYALDKYYKNKNKKT
ncbi:unnamed protein product, partial [Brenthis ino]